MYCQKNMEGEKLCEIQCDHCMAYYSYPLKSIPTVYSKSLLEDAVVELSRQERNKVYGDLHHPLRRKTTKS